MVSTSAQRRASAHYNEKRKAEGFNQHLIWATNIQWAVLLEIVRFVKKLDLSRIKSLELDDNGEFIRFIYQKPPETRVVLTNQSQDDKS